MAPFQHRAWIMWATALTGMAIKLLWPGRFDRTSVALYLIMGWSGIFLFEPIASRACAGDLSPTPGGVLIQPIFHV